MVKFIRVSSCENCPCLNKDYDECTCNLKCKAEFLCTRDEGLIYVSTNCELSSIDIGSKAIKTVTINATYLRPEKL